MNYKQASVVIFTIPTVVQIFTKDLFGGWTFIPLWVLKQVKLFLKKVPIHIKQLQTGTDGESINVEREVIVLPYFNGYYEDMMGEKFKWKDPIHLFVNDVDQEILQKTDAVVWVFTSQKNAKHMLEFFQSITTEVCIYNDIGEHDTHAVISLPMEIAV